MVDRLRQTHNISEFSPLICISMMLLYGTALLLDICSETLTLRRLTLLKFSLLARPARAASEYSEVLFTEMRKYTLYKNNTGLLG